MAFCASIKRCSICGGTNWASATFRCGALGSAHGLQPNYEECLNYFQTFTENPFSIIVNGSPLYRTLCIYYAKSTMWNVEERFTPKQIESLAALGFAVGRTRGVVRVEKYGSGAEFRKGTDDLYQMTVVPTIMLKGRFTRLWDAGYQKFLLTDDGLKLPALATHLQNLRKFNEELRTALGVPTFYNEALGSVSQISVYDRVKGRVGDVPDKTVGAHEPGGGR